MNKNAKKKKVEDFHKNFEKKMKRKFFRNLFGNFLESTHFGIHSLTPLNFH